MATTVALQPTAYDHHPVDTVPSLTSLRTALAMASIISNSTSREKEGVSNVGGVTTGTRLDTRRSSLQRADSGSTTTSSGTSPSLSTAETAPEYPQEEEDAPSYIVPTAATAIIPPAPSSTSSSSRPPSLKTNTFRLEFRGVVKWVRWPLSSPSTVQSQQERGLTMPRLGCLGAIRDPRLKNSASSRKSKSRNHVSLLDALRLPDATPALPTLPLSETSRAVIDRVRAAQSFSDTPSTPSSMTQTLHHLSDPNQLQPTIFIHHPETSIPTLLTSQKADICLNPDQEERHQTRWSIDVIEDDDDQEAALAELQSRKERRRTGQSFGPVQDSSASFDTQRHPLPTFAGTEHDYQQAFTPGSPTNSSSNHHLSTRSEIAPSPQPIHPPTPSLSVFDHSDIPIVDNTEVRNAPSRAKTSVSRRISLSVRDRLKRSFSLHNTFTPVTPPPPPLPSRVSDSSEHPTMTATLSNILSAKSTPTTGVDYKLLNKSKRSGSLSGLSLKAHYHEVEHSNESAPNGESERTLKPSLPTGMGSKISRAMSLSVPSSLRISTKNTQKSSAVAPLEPLPPLPPIPALSPIFNQFDSSASLEREHSKKGKLHRRRRSRTKSQPELPSPNILQLQGGDEAAEGDYITFGAGAGERRGSTPTVTDVMGRGVGTVSLPASAFGSTTTLPGTIHPYYVSPTSPIPPVPALPSDLLPLATPSSTLRRKLTKKRRAGSAQNSVDLTMSPLPLPVQGTSDASAIPPSTWKLVNSDSMDRSNSSSSSSGRRAKLRKKSRSGSMSSKIASPSGDADEEMGLLSPESASMPSSPVATVDGHRRRGHRSKLSSIDTTNGSIVTESSPNSSSQRIAPLSSLVYVGHHGYYEREIMRAEMEKRLAKEGVPEETERGRTMQMNPDVLLGSALSTSPEMSPPVALSPTSPSSIEARSPFLHPETSLSPEPKGPGNSRERSASRRRGDSIASIAVPYSVPGPSASTTKFMTSPSSPNFAAGQNQGPRQSLYEEFPHIVVPPVPVLTVEGNAVTFTDSPTGESSKGSSASKVDLVQFLALPEPSGSRPTLQHRASSNAARRWTIAISDIPDDGEFLKEIDDLKKANEVSRSSSNKSDAGSGSDDELEEDEEADEGEEEIVWMKARRAILCVREILRTEVSYRDHMLRVLEVETTNSNPTTPTALLLHLPALVSASSALASRLEEDPSAWGVSAAFLASVVELEQAMVGWSKVVGEVMVEFARLSLTADNKKEKPKRSDTANSIVGRRVGRKPRPASMDPASAGVTTGQSSGRPNAYGVGKGKALSTQDIAIMPTQRVPRYVMLFRDLLHHTPVTSPSRALVERALEAAMRLAKNCNQAQDHTSLIARSATA